MDTRFQTMQQAQEDISSIQMLNIQTQSNNAKERKIHLSTLAMSALLASQVSLALVDNERERECNSRDLIDLD